MPVLKEFMNHTTPKTNLKLSQRGKGSLIIANAFFFLTALAFKSQSCSLITKYDFIEKVS